MEYHLNEVWNLFGLKKIRVTQWFYGSLMKNLCSLTTAWDNKIWCKNTNQFQSKKCNNAPSNNQFDIEIKEKFYQNKSLLFLPFKIELPRSKIAFRLWRLRL